MNKYFKIIFIITIFIYCTGINCVNCIPDNDIWARLITGAHTFEMHEILKQDFLSFTPTHTWYDHEWGASLIFYIIYKYFGTTGLILIKGILSSLIIFTAYKTVELRNPKNSISFNILYFILMYTAFSSNLGHTVRCLMFSCLFFAIFMYILEKARSGKQKILILLPILMIFWSNIHGGCLSGLGLIGLYIAGEFLNKKPVRNYIYTFIASLAALFINPYGIEYVKFLFKAGLLNRGHITEWQSSFHSAYLKSYYNYKTYLAVMTVIPIIHLILNKIKYKEWDKTKIIITIIMAYLSIAHVRHQFFFVYTAGVLWYDEFYGIFNTLMKLIREKLHLNEIFCKNFVTLKEITVYTLLLIATIPALISAKEIRITETKFPRFGVEFIKINEIKGNLLVDFDYGSYCSYKLYPNNLIYMDGRYEEVYNPKLLEELKDFMMLKGNWKNILDKYHIDVIILDRDKPVFDKLSKDSDWKVVFSNNISGVFVPMNKAKDSYILPPHQDEYYNKNVFKTDINFKK